MKTRTAIVTALALLALTAPAAQANIPSDHEGVWWKLPSKLPKKHLTPRHHCFLNGTGKVIWVTSPLVCPR